MREIKFRVWDKKREMMISWHQLFYEETSQGEYLHRALTDPDYTLMQYTGLKDKNGKDDIWESDIVESEEGGIYIVDFKRGGFWACYPLDHRTIFFLNDNNWKILGNIYENKELLK